MPPNQLNSPTRQSRLSIPYGSALFSSEYISLHEHSLCQVCRANIPSVVLLLAHYVTIILIHILPLSRTPPAFVWKTSTSPLQPIWRVYWEMQYCLGECRIGVCPTRRCMIAFFLSPKSAQQTEYRYNRRVAVCQSKQPLRWILRMFYESGLRQNTPEYLLVSSLTTFIADWGTLNPFRASTFSIMKMPQFFEHFESPYRTQEKNKFWRMHHQDNNNSFWQLHRVTWQKSTITPPPPERRMYEVMC